MGVEVQGCLCEATSMPLWSSVVDDFQLVRERKGIEWFPECCGIYN
jgi:hypothetical protein